MQVSQTARFWLRRWWSSKYPSKFCGTTKIQGLNSATGFFDRLVRSLTYFGFFFWRSGICKKRCRFSQNEWDVYGKLHFCEKKSELPQPWLNQFSWAFGTPLSIISIGWWLDISSGWRLTIAQARLAAPVVRSKQWTFAGYAIPLIPVKFNEKLRLQRWSGYSNVSAARDLGHSWAPHSIGSPAGKANRKANRNFPVWQRFIATLFHPQRWHSWFLCRILGYNFSGDANPNWGTKKISQQGVIKLYAYIMYIYIYVYIGQTCVYIGILYTAYYCT